MIGTNPRQSSSGKPPARGGGGHKEGGGCGRAKMAPFVLFAFFPCFIGSCCVFSLFCRHFGCLGSWNPNSPFVLFHPQSGPCLTPKTLPLRTLFPLTAFKKCPEPQICPKFVPTIVFRGSNQGDKNLSKNCRKFEKRQFPDKFSNFRQFFDKFGSP